MNHHFLPFQTNRIRMPKIALLTSLLLFVALATTLIASPNNLDSIYASSPLMLTATPLPDLVVNGMRIELQSGGACNFTSTNLGVRVWFQNVGDADAGPFVVEINDVQQPFSAGLAAGETGSLWLQGYNGGKNSAFVDVTNKVTESNEDNNQRSEPVPIPTLPVPCTPTPSGTPTITPTPSGTPTTTPTPTTAPSTALPSTITPIPTEVPESIEARANGNSQSIHVEWILTRPLSGSLDHYDLYRKADGGEFALIGSLTGSQSTDDDSALMANVEYCYQIKAVDSSKAVVGESNVVCTELGKPTIWMPHQVIPSNAANIPVPIHVANAHDLCIRSFELSISYDTTIVNANGMVQPTLYASPFTLHVFNTSPDQLIISGNRSPCVRLYGPGPLLHVFFDAQGSQGEVSSLDIIGAIWDNQSDFNPISIDTPNGSLTVAANGFRGDVNLDGEVNLADARLALEMTNLSMTPTAQEEAACDLNGDRACNAADSSLIMCHIATQNGTECAHEVNLSQEPVEVKIGSASSLPARPEIVTIPIEIRQAQDFSGGHFSFTYNPEEMSAIDASLTELSNNFQIKTHISEPGLLQVSLAANTPIAADGTILTLELAIKESLSSLNFGTVRLHDTNGRDFETSVLQREIELVPYQATTQNLLYLPLVIR